MRSWEIPSAGTVTGEACNVQNNGKCPHYQQDGETVFTVEYDVAQHENLDRSSGGPILVEIRRDVGDIVGFGLNVDPGSGHVFVESIKQVGIGKKA